MKVVIIHGLWFLEEALAVIRDVARVAVPADASEAALRAELEDADALVVSFDPRVDRGLIAAAPGLRHVARLGVGVDNIDLKAATERGLFVTNTPDVTADSVAEFTLALLLALAKNIPACDRAVKGGRWGDRQGLIRLNRELHGKTHGIVGMGKIGGRVAIRCRAFGMRVLYQQRHRDPDFERAAGVAYAPFAALLRESDSISLHLPLTQETTNLFDRPQFESMKEKALLINQARGPVVNEEALVWALREGRIGGYGTDVYSSEPPDPQSELLGFGNVIASPHLGGANYETRLRTCMMIAEDVVRVIRGDLPLNLVNREVLGQEDLKAFSTDPKG
jgi:phosphoglycerate dehydrogenase-like enzyme